LILLWTAQPSVRDSIDASVRRGEGMMTFRLRVGDFALIVVDIGLHLL